MSVIHGYEYDKSSAHNSPNGTWYKASYGGVNYFLKKFSWPKYPKEGCSESLYSEMKSDSENWLDQKIKIINALDEIGNGTGNIVSPREVFREKLSFYQTTYWVDSLVNSVEEMSRLDEDNKLMILQTFSSALSKVHNKNIVHGDLKPDNIIISKNSNNKYVAKIIDFDDSYFSGNVFSPQNTIVTDAYQSPELAAYKRGHMEYHDLIKCSSDVFAAGIIFHQFWCGCFPKYNGMEDGRFLFEAVSSDERYELGEMPLWLNKLITMMLDADCSHRPSMDYVYNCIRNRKIFEESSKKCEVAADKSTVIDSYVEESVITVKIPENLSCYSFQTVEKLRKEIKFAEDNKTILDADYLNKRIQKAVDNLELKNEENILYIVNSENLDNYEKVEIISNDKIKVYLKKGNSSILPATVALAMKLIKKK
ncbi:MAG: protein kinase [Oscillospiraceae bacterium]|nr:protein kinase [Oscillospiraceae bacterium]